MSLTPNWSSLTDESAWTLVNVGLADELRRLGERARRPRGRVARMIESLLARLQRELVRLSD